VECHEQAIKHHFIFEQSSSRARTANSRPPLIFSEQFRSTERDRKIKREWDEIVREVECGTLQ